MKAEPFVRGLKFGEGLRWHGGRFWVPNQTSVSLVMSRNEYWNESPSSVFWGWPDVERYFRRRRDDVTRGEFDQCEAS
jgi:hypothetical protein